MNWSVLFAEPQPIASHALIAIGAFGLGAAQLALPKGGGRHRAIGYVWVAAMAFVAASGFFIHEIELIGPFSPIHILSIVTLVSLWFAVRAARAGDIRRHKAIMLSLFALALVVTGAFTLLPGRAMHAVLFGGVG
ncbi:MAG: DUF2306 domain-containing protein [Pseudomonadota bacterium]